MARIFEDFEPPLEGDGCEKCIAPIEKSIDMNRARKNDEGAEGDRGCDRTGSDETGKESERTRDAPDDGADER